MKATHELLAFRRDIDNTTKSGLIQLNFNAKYASKEVQRRTHIDKHIAINAQTALGYTRSRLANTESKPDGRKWTDTQKKKGEKLIGRPERTRRAAKLMDQSLDAS